MPRRLPPSTFLPPVYLSTSSLPPVYLSLYIPSISLRLVYLSTSRLRPIYVPSTSPYLTEFSFTTHRTQSHDNHYRMNYVYQLTTRLAKSSISLVRFSALYSNQKQEPVSLAIACQRWFIRDTQLGMISTVVERIRY
jgi:hypothetical protein